MTDLQAAATPLDPNRRLKQAEDHHAAGRRAVGTLARAVTAAGDLYGEALAVMLSRRVEDVGENMSEAIYHLEQRVGELSLELHAANNRADGAREFANRATRAYLMLAEELEQRATRRKLDKPAILHRAHNVYMGREPDQDADDEAPF